MKLKVLQFFTVILFALVTGVWRLGVPCKSEGEKL